MSKQKDWKKSKEPKRKESSLEKEVAKSNPEFVKWLQSRKPRGKMKEEKTKD